MHVITRTRLVEFWGKHPASKTSLLLWNKIAFTAKWRSIVEVRKVFPSADQVGKLTVFNVSGNKYRLVTFVDYTHQKIFIRKVLTHADYDKNDWKKDTWY
jgi:mRNA interferase HigB